MTPMGIAATMDSLYLGHCLRKVTNLALFKRLRLGHMLLGLIFNYIEPLQHSYPSALTGGLGVVGNTIECYHLDSTNWLLEAQHIFFFAFLIKQKMRLKCVLSAHHWYCPIGSTKGAVCCQ